MSTLERCYLPSLQIGSTHPVWDSVQSNRLDGNAGCSERAYPDGDISTRYRLPRGRGGEGEGGNLGVILVRVCEPVFQNLPYSFTWLPYSYTWPSKKRTHSCTKS